MRRSKSINRVVRRFAAGAALVAATMASLLVAPAPASAATGGGCSGDYYASWGYFAACISSPDHGLVRADAYTTFTDKGSSCSMQLRIIDTSYVVKNYVNMSCYTSRPGATGDVWYVASSGSYRAELKITRNGVDSFYRGPQITLP